MVQSLPFGVVYVSGTVAQGSGYSRIQGLE